MNTTHAGLTTEIVDDGQQASTIIEWGNGLRHIMMACGATPARRRAAVIRMAKQAISKALRDGETLRRIDGSTVWRSRDPVFNSAGTGSSQYTWHPDGERILCEWIEYTWHPDGTQSRSKLRQVWVLYSNAI